MNSERARTAVPRQMDLRPVEGLPPAIISEPTAKRKGLLTLDIGAAQLSRRMRRLMVDQNKIQKWTFG
jgi:hypothetical protein